jgi:hypothetical protein
VAFPAFQCSGVPETPTLATPGRLIPAYILTEKKTFLEGKPLMLATGIIEISIYIELAESISASGYVCRTVP